MIRRARLQVSIAPPQEQLRGAAAAASDSAAAADRTAAAAARQAASPLAPAPAGPPAAPPADLVSAAEAWREALQAKSADIAQLQARTWNTHLDLTFALVHLFSTQTFVETSTNAASEPCSSSLQSRLRSLSIPTGGALRSAGGRPSGEGGGGGGARRGRGRLGGACTRGGAGGGVCV